MESFDKLEKKVTELVERFDAIQNERNRLDSECTELRERVKSLEAELKKLGDDNIRLEKAFNANNDLAVKRISRLVDKIDHFQSDLKIS